MRNRFNFTMHLSDLMTLLTVGSVQVVSGKDELWIRASNSLRKSIKVEGLPRESAEGKPLQHAERSFGFPQNSRS